MCITSSFPPKGQRTKRQRRDFSALYCSDSLNYKRFVGYFSALPQRSLLLGGENKILSPGRLYQQKSLFSITVLLLNILLFIFGNFQPVYASTPQSNTGSQKRTDSKSTQEPINEGGATSTSRLALPFKRLWQYLEETTAFAPAVDEQRIYL